MLDYTGCLIIEGSTWGAKNSKKKLDNNFDIFFKYYIDEILTTEMYMSNEVLVKISGL